jgi:hypothetical protein
VFGQEIGELQPYEAYLKEALVGRQALSAFSKKPLFISSGEYDPGCRFFDYQTEQERLEPLNAPLDLNRLKDIDSVVEVVQERLVYSGNKVMGRSQAVEQSDNITDSIDVQHSVLIIRGQHMAYCSFMLDGEYCFGCTDFTNHPTSLIRCFYGNSTKRSFECAYPVSSSDCLFCHNVENCTECMFCFNVKAKRYAIGNVEYPKEEYLKIKKLLLAEISARLEKDKKLDLDIYNLGSPSSAKAKESGEKL